jgi:hypothetical protein
MIPDTIWMQEKFAYYNEKYFYNKIKTPKFEIKNLGNNWGYFSSSIRVNLLTRNVTNIYNNGILYLTNKYSRLEKDIENTLIHEMIHAYIWTVIKKYPLFHHGKYFKKIAARINKDGWDIKMFNDIKNSDIKVKSVD